MVKFEEKVEHQSTETHCILILFLLFAYFYKTVTLIRTFNHWSLAFLREVDHLVNWEVNKMSCNVEMNRDGFLFYILIICFVNLLLSSPSFTRVWHFQIWIEKLKFDQYKLKQPFMRVQSVHVSGCESLIIISLRSGCESQSQSRSRRQNIKKKVKTTKLLNHSSCLILTTSTLKSNKQKHPPPLSGEDVCLELPAAPANFKGTVHPKH